ncbi:hypothetical protein OHA25_22945 [Nonomuraea sp. NBC_00507]|uniref:hypothetical protein n=1 Tax=Nonomuraea sp. NBC_00507 TaxID=2976002 RepID=UPI002E178BD4
MGFQVRSVEPAPDMIAIRGVRLGDSGADAMTIDVAVMEPGEDRGRGGHRLGLAFQRWLFDRHGQHRAAARKSLSSTVCRREARKARNPATGPASSSRFSAAATGAGVALFQQVAVAAQDGVRTHEEPRPAQDLARQRCQERGEQPSRCRPPAPQCRGTHRAA